LTNKTKANSTRQNKLINRIPFFYGWIIMAAGTLGIIMTSPGQTYSQSIFIEYLLRDFTISRSLISSLYALGTLVGGFSLPFWGRQIDRHGTRKMTTLIALIFGLACIYMGFVQNAFMIGLGFILIRMMGQGSLGLVSQTAINQWWMNKRGMIMGISGLLMALLGMGAFPGLVYRLITAFDWRASYMILGAAVLVIMVPVGAIFFRNHPEQYGLKPDGESHDDPDGSVLADPLLSAEENWTLKEALKTRTFWIFGISSALFAMLITGLTFHLVSIFETQGLEPALAATVFVPIALTAALIGLVVGYLTDHVQLRYLLAVGLLLQAISLIMGLWIQGATTALLFGVVVGATNGVSRALSSVSWPSFFGRKHLGSIYGFTAAMTVIGAALGPLPFGFAFDMIGSYSPVLYIFSGVSLLLGLISLTAVKPKKSELD